MIGLSRPLLREHARATILAVECVLSVYNLSYGRKTGRATILASHHVPSSPPQNRPTSSDEVDAPTLSEVVSLFQ